MGGRYESHLFATCLSGESLHHEIQLSELTQSSTDVSVKVFVFLILIIENCFVLFPFLHTADLWILATERRHTVKLILCMFQTNGVIQLTWCSLQWCALWGSDWLDSFGRHVEDYPDCYNLYSALCQLHHPWMICVLLLPVWVGWTVETPPEAEGKRKTSFGKYKTNEQDVHNTILACAIITWRLLFWKIQLHFFNGTIMFTSGFSSFLILHYYTYYPNTPLQKTIETCLLHRLCGDLHSQ